MGISTIGKVLVTAKVQNLFDLERCEQRLIPPKEVRTVEVNDALVDTGATGLMLPKRLIEFLGLRHFKTRQARGIGGTVPMLMYSAVRLTIQERDCSVDVGEIPNDYPVLIGQVPLELLDWIVDLRGQKLIGNPEHGGEQMMDVF